MIPTKNASINFLVGTLEANSRLIVIREGCEAAMEFCGALHECFDMMSLSPFEGQMGFMWREFI